MAQKSLVIVESPAKAKTIGRYLGDGYRVKASMGHLRDLPKSEMGVDIDHGFRPDYQPVAGREDTIEDLRKEARNADRVFLATDPDRDGEAIAWHLQALLGLPGGQQRRVTFNEITKGVVLESIQHPRDIDQNLVDAQQARRVLDRIVGYKLSPLLWRKVRRGLSAGRVQSVAVRMVADREEEIRSFVPEEFWYLDAHLACIDHPGAFTARYSGTNGKKRELRSREETEKIAAEAAAAPFSVTSVKRTEKRRSPAPPFITSTLQQEASRRLGMTPRRTMAVAQQLYEGVDVKDVGTVGLITYMRTDSLRLSDEALAAAARFIKEKYGPAYHPGTFRRFKVKGSAQDAHEAIRPTNVDLTPEVVRGSLTQEQYRLYRLVWSRFVASQMSAAVYDTVTVDVTSAGHLFRAASSALKFAGHTAVYEESRDEEPEEEKNPLPPLTEGEPLRLEKTTQEQHFTQPPSRYTEATLVKAMEETGVGRPSTYAPTVSTILDREYTVKEGKYLRPTNLGEAVTGLMKERFPDIVDLKFTARMEEELDTVESGQRPWVDVLEEFYGPFRSSLENAEKALEGTRVKVPDELSDETCDLCGRRMVIKNGRFGRFLACPGYPECKFTKPIVLEMPGRCPQCGGRLLKKTSRKGYPYYACENTKAPDKDGNVPAGACSFLTWDVPVKDDCPKCGQTMFKKSGKGYKRPFCINPECPNFVPEEKRGYPKKTAEGETSPAAPADQKAPAAKKPAAKKPAAKKTAGKTSGKTAGKSAGSAAKTKKRTAK